MNSRSLPQDFKWRIENEYQISRATARMCYTIYFNHPQEIMPWEK